MPDYGDIIDSGAVMSLQLQNWSEIAQTCKVAFGESGIKSRFQIRLPNATCSRMEPKQLALCKHWECQCVCSLRGIPRIVVVSTAYHRMQSNRVCKATLLSNYPKKLDVWYCCCLHCMVRPLAKRRSAESEAETSPQNSSRTQKPTSPQKLF